MQIGVVGQKFSGKTTVFGALTGISADSVKGGSKSNLGEIKVPDERVEKLSSIFDPVKTTYTEIKFIDVQTENESRRESKGIDPKTVVLIRSSDALVVVVRSFDNPAVPHPFNEINPLRDFMNFETELITSDFIQIENRLERMKKENSKGVEADILLRCKEYLENEKPLRLLSFSESEMKAIGGFQFLSQKPLMVLVNTSEDENREFSELNSEVEKCGATVMTLSARLEQELSELPEEERADYLKEMGIDRSAKERFIQASYSMMKLISFFTIGQDEVRAWTIKEGTKALHAAGRIHTDLERGFIRADVVHYDDFIKSGSIAKTRTAGYLHQEGKEYIVQDGDILEIRFNV